MKTAKVYMVRKPSDFDEIKTLCKKYEYAVEEILIEETIHLLLVRYAVLCQHPLANYIFLSGKGDYDDTGTAK